MKIFRILFVLFAFVIAVSSSAATGKKIIKPKNVSETVKVKILGKTYKYYLLNPETPAIISVRGPAKIKIYTRAALRRNTANKTDYILEYLLDGKEKRTKKIVNVPLSRKAEFIGAEEFVPTENRNLTIRIPEGYHTVELYARNSGEKIYAKFHLFKKTRKKKKWISLAPLAPVNPVNIIVNEELSEYYRFSKKNPVRVSVIGPTKLRILTRAETTNSTKKNVSYRIAVYEKDKLKNSYLLWTNRSYSARYEKDEEFIPNKAREIIIDVPEGLHVFEIVTPDENMSVLARFFIPFKDVNIGLRK